MILTLYPVIQKIHYHAHGYDNNKPSTRIKIKIQSMCALDSLKASGQRSGFYPEKLRKGARGQPLPSNGVFWSVSHKGDYTAGLVSKSAAGIDVELIKNVSDPLSKRIVSENEKKCFEDDDSDIIFFRCFTAKEAVLKSAGVGLTGLSGISVVKVEDLRTLILEYKNTEYKVEHIFFDKYIASVVKDNYKVKWHIE